MLVRKILLTLLKCDWLIMQPIAFSHNVSALVLMVEDESGKGFATVLKEQIKKLRKQLGKEPKIKAFGGARAQQQPTRYEATSGPSVPRTLPQIYENHMRYLYG